MPVESDLPDLARGDYRRIKVTITDADGNGVNIVGDLLTITFKRDKNNDVDPGALQTSVTVPNDLDGQNGIGYLPLEKSQTEVLDIIQYDYDIQWVDSDATPEPRPATLVIGRISIVQDVTLDTV